jgi:hypothetical protein
MVVLFYSLEKPRRTHSLTDLTAGPYQTKAGKGGHTDHKHPLIDNNKKRLGGHEKMPAISIVGIDTSSDKKNGKGGHKLPLRLKLKEPCFDTHSDKRWQRWA